MIRRTMFLSPSLAPPVALALMLALGLPLTSSAGDPCPISLTFYDLGSPAGVDHDALLDGLKSAENWVGISFGNAKAGVTIRAVSVGGPSEKGGMKVGDVVKSLNGKAVKTHPELSALIDTIPPGGKATFAIVRGGEDMTLTFNFGRHDPVFGRVVSYAATDDCHKVRRGDLEEPVRVALAARLVKKSGKLACSDAHKRIEKNDQALSGGDILVLRSKDKVLLTMPGERTVCVKAADVDGKKLTKRAIKRLFRRVAGDYLDSRHANP